MASKITKKYKRAKYITLALIIICNVLPMLIFVIDGFIKGTPKEKLCLSITTFVSLFLLILNVLFKSHLKRTIFVIMFAGVYICMQDLKSVFIVYGIFTIIDELILTPIYAFCKDKYSNNKDIDKRLGE